MWDERTPPNNNNNNNNDNHIIKLPREKRNHIIKYACSR